MLRRLSSIIWIVAIAGFAVAQSPPSKPALTHSHYEIWNSASGLTLSDDGQWLAYSQLPPEGDGVVIVRNLFGTAEYSIPRGGRPRNAGTTTPPPTTPSGLTASSPQFSPDGRKVLLPLSPTEEEREKAKAAKKEATTVLAVMDLSTGKITERLTQIKAFTVVEKTNYLVLHKEIKPVNTTALGATVSGLAFVPRTIAPPTATPTAGSTGRTFRGRTPGTTRSSSAPPSTPETPRQVTGTDLVVRNLADGKETTFTSVLEYSITDDGKALVLEITSGQDDKAGLFAVELGTTALQTVKTGKGKYSRLSWDEPQKRLAFYYETPAPAAKPNEPRPVVKPSVYLWERTAKKPARELVNASTPGIKDGLMLSDRSGIRFSADGEKLVLGLTKVPEPTKPGATSNSSTADKVDLDLWHWKDELIQPMQKVRGDSERNRSTTAVYLFDKQELRPLSDENLTVFVPDFGDWALASNDKAYRYLTGYGPSLSDYSFVNIRTGEQKPLLTAFEGSLSGSPRGKYRVAFDGQHWLCFSVPGGTKCNLTEKLPVKFFNESFDMPMKPSSFGISGWTHDEKYVLLNDKYDIWKVACDGSGAENLTKIGREMNLNFDIVEFPDPDGTPRRGLDLTKPLMLRATNLETRDTGYYRLSAGQKPQLLIMGNCEYGRPTKAKRADTLLFTVSTFATYPDYHVTNSDFREIRRVTDINPKCREFNWGTSELVRYKSADGLPLSGMLIKPENFDRTKKYPMIVYIYERLSDGLHRFRLPSAGTSINPTYYASNGYLVFMPDIAYAPGSPGQSAMKCVLPAIQAVVDQGYVNEDAIGIQGHSWGGYQIAYMVTQTKRFKAAASGAPVSNMVSAYGGIRWGTGLPRQFQYERTQSRIGSTLWEAPMKFIENSPIFMADRVTTPLMILHNDQDDAVPWYQGIEYYLALRRLGRECYLFNYNGELHGLRKKATQRDYTLRMQQFFDHHLKGEPMPEWMKSGIAFTDRDKEKEQWSELFKPSAANAKP